MSMNSSILDFPLQAAPKSSGKRRSGAALWEASRIAVDSVWTHKLRSVLTLLGIIIGIASVVTVGGAIEGLGSYVSDRVISSFGSNTFIVSRFARVNVSNEDFEKIIKRNKNLYPEDMRAVEQKCEGCEAISPSMNATSDAKRGNHTFYDASVVGVSADPVAKLEDFTKENRVKHSLLSDFGRKMLPAYGVMVTDAKSPMYRLAKRAYFILDRQGIVRFVRVQANPLDLLKTEEVLKALKRLGT